MPSSRSAYPPVWRPSHRVTFVDRERKGKVGRKGRKLGGNGKGRKLVGSCVRRGKGRERKRGVVKVAGIWEGKEI